jgi:proteasome assembly chaperone (PAC2) family protein
MNKTEIAEALRQQVGELEVSINKLQARCEKLKRFVLDLEEEIAGPAAQNQKPVEDSKFRKVVDQIFGEKPTRPKR